MQCCCDGVPGVRAAPGGERAGARLVGHDDRDAERLGQALQRRRLRACRPQRPRSRVRV